MGALERALRVVPARRLARTLAARWASERERIFGADVLDGRDLAITCEDLALPVKQGATIRKEVVHASSRRDEDVARQSTGKSGTEVAIARQEVVNASAAHTWNNGSSAATLEPRH